MYRIYCDDKLIYDPRDETKQLISASVSLAENAPSECKFEILPMHELANHIKKLKSVIKVYDGDELLFRGRVISSESNLYGMTNFICEGDLALLFDSIQRPKEYHNLTPRVYLQDKIDQHNRCVDVEKHFTLGVVEIETMNYDAREDNQYTNTLDTIMDKLVKNNGGYLHVRYAQGKRYLDYRKSLGRSSGQTIRFGQNLLDLTEHINAENIITVLVPLGKVSEDANEGEKLTIASVNDGRDYLEDPEAISLYGRIEGTEIWDDVTVPSNLKAKGEEYLSGIRNLATTIELTAVDLHLVDVDIDRIGLGDMVRVVSPPHRVDRNMPVSKRSYDLLNPARDKMILGDTINTLTEKQAAIQKAINKNADVKAEVQSISISVARASGEVRRIDERVQEIDTGYSSVQELIENISNNVAELSMLHKDDVSDIEEKINAILERLEILEGGVSEQ